MQVVHGKSGIQIQESISSEHVLLTTAISCLEWRKTEAFEVYQRGRIARIWQLTGHMV